MEQISHSAVIKEIGEREITVEIVSESACASCAAAGLCTAAEAVKKLIKVPADPHGGFSVGETVDVLVRQSLGMKAVAICYVVPLLILLLLVVSLSYTSMGEVAVGLAGLGATALYYLALYLFRGRIAKDYVFTIKHK